MNTPTVSGISPAAMRLAMTVAARTSPSDERYVCPSVKTISAAGSVAVASCSGTHTHQSRRTWG